MARDDNRPAGSGGAADPQVAVTGTGNASAASEATAVSGYRGPAPGTETATAAPVRVSATGDATASEGGLANSGYIHHVRAEKLTVVQQRPPREPAAWPHQVGVIPSRAQSFQHRAEMERLRTAVGDAAPTVPRQGLDTGSQPSRVLAGLGGVGKTQLAADFARAAWYDGSLDVLVWITASARSSVVDGYAQAGVELCRADPTDSEQAARAFLAWLTPKAGQRPCRWLVVLDDVADPDDLRGLWPPAGRYGRTVVTTRRRDAVLSGEGRRVIEVGLFTEAEAVAYLTAFLAAHGRHEPADQLKALACDLGNLPLALAQAAAYLVDSGEAAAAYRALLADRATTLADTTPDRLPDDQAAPLAAAWSLSLDRADTLRPVGLARPVLHLAALLDPNGVPQEVLTSRPALAHLARHRARTGQALTGASVPVSARDAVRALRALHRLSLIDHTPDVPERAVRVHHLVQRATRDVLATGQRDRCARTAADALLAAWPDIERDTGLAQALRANTGALTAHAEDALFRPDVHEVLYRTANSFGDCGQITAAIQHYRYLVDAAGRRLGEDHPDTLDARAHLASWRGRAGDAAGAVAAFAHLLDRMARLLPPDHPDILTTRHDLGTWRGRAGDVDGAVGTFAELLPDRVRVLGEHHPDTLANRHNLAWWRGEAGDTGGAVTGLEELLPDAVRALGPDHPYTLTTRHSLARWRGETGDAPGAVTALEELLPDQVRVLGPDHLDTLTTRQNLARWRGKAGNPAGAAAALAELLADRIRVLGTDHPDTLTTRADLAHWRAEAGKADAGRHL
ncbi:FxSxx-COOH system tetratricopeptide repeat protein [Streptomyces sp. NPDC006393]|uniref:FxSxx-COOH system tetratricopeptide repeat protein n=1 Tax=Streptomyces sp. NPDC006393 TaxID=3156763 RepID=UPI0033D4B7BB